MYVYLDIAREEYYRYSIDIYSCTVLKYYYHIEYVVSRCFYRSVIRTVNVTIMGFSPPRRCDSV